MCVRERGYLEDQAELLVEERLHGRLARHLLQCVEVLGFRDLTGKEGDRLRKRERVQWF